MSEANPAMITCAKEKRLINMDQRRRFFSIGLLWAGLLYAGLLRAEDLLTNQAGTSIPAGTWTNITSTITGLAGSKIPYYVTGWDKYFPVPAIDRYCGLGSYWEPSSEPNRSWSCYSFVENRWDMWDMTGSFHTEHLPEGGHPVGFSNIDPTTSIVLGPCCFSGSQVAEENKQGMWQYDFYAQVGIPRQTPTGLNINNQLGSAAYDPFNQLLVGFGGDSSSQATVQYDNNPGHTSCGTSGVNCYNSWALPITTTGTAPAASLVEHSMAINTADKQIYLYGGFASAAAQNGLFRYNAATSVWTALTPTCVSNGSGTLCPGQTIVSAATSANPAVLTATGNNYQSNGSGGTAVTIAGATGCWAALNGQLVVTVVSSGSTFSVPVNTSACSQPITGTVTATVGRVLESFAYDANDNIFLMHGGFSTYGISGLNNSGQFLDTWVYDPAANVWTQQNPGTSPSYCASLCAPNERLAWMAEDNVFLLFVNPGGAGQTATMWAYRYAPGGKAGYKTVSYSYTAASPIGPLNRNTASATSQGHAYGAAIAASATAIYTAWTETLPGQNGAGNGWLLHPYAQQALETGNTCGGLSTPNFACLGSLYSSMSPDVGGNPHQSFDIGCTIISAAPWCIWHEQNAGLTEFEEAKGWDGSGWNLGGAVPQVAATAYDGPGGIVGVAGVPTVVMREQDRTTGNVPYPTYAYVKQWGGSSWALVGGKLNSGTSVAESVAIASDGTNPWVAMTLYTPSNTGNPDGVNISAPQVELFQWTGSAWTQPCAASGNVTSTDRAFNISLAWLGGQPYVAFVERTNVGLVQKLWIRTCSGGVWSTVGGGYLNRDQSFGWAFRPELNTDGIKLYVAWAEQGNDQPWLAQLALMSAHSQKPRVYVASVTTGGTVSYLGGALNADTANGAATHPSLAIYSGLPVVAWHEIVRGNLGQVYARQWNGVDWGLLGAQPGSGSAVTGRVTISGTTLQ